MPTCFLFAEHIDEEQCLCLRLDEQGRVDVPLDWRPLSEVRALQANARTVVVVPTEKSSLHDVELPWLGERKARLAIPFALEDQLAQEVTSLHFAFDRQHYQNQRYLVAVTDKQYLIDLFAQLDALYLSFDVVTLDWFALNEQEACITEHNLLVRDNLFKGALSGEIATLYLSKEERKSELLVFDDSASLIQDQVVTKINNLSSVWIAERLCQANAMNLCQGELQHDSRILSSTYWFKACGIAAVALLSSVILVNALYLHALNTDIADQDKKIAVIYHDFFPNSPRVISPKFRISQQLKEGNLNRDPTAFWTLLNKLSHVFDSKQSVIEQFHFQTPILSVTLNCKNFAVLENLQQRLQQDNVKVAQSQAASHEGKVVATLELSIGASR